MKLPLWRRHQRRELDAEIESHLRLAIAERVERGESPAAARRSALREFGNVAAVKDVTRDMWGWSALEQVVDDVRYALRTLRKTPAFTTVAVLTFALGIGANTAMFSVINAVMLRPLPFPNADRLIDVTGLDLRRGPAAAVPSSTSWPDFFDYRTRVRALERLTAFFQTSFTMTAGRRALHVEGVVSSAELFDTLGVAPMLGRAFRIEDERAGSDVVILSHALWRSEFGGAPDIVGRIATLNSRPFTIVGVMPPGFTFPLSAPRPELWVTLAEAARVETADDTPMTTQRSAHYLGLIGRLKSDATIAAAQSDLDSVTAALAKEYPDDDGTRGIRVRPYVDVLVGDVRQPLMLLLIAVGCVLVIASVNLANLLLVRSTGRGHELALRFAIGASRGRIVRQLLTEAIVLSALGTAAGILLAMWSLRFLVEISPTDLHGLSDVALDRAVLVFTAVIALASAIGFGLVPALSASRVDPNRELQDNTARGTSAPRIRRLRTGLVVAETAIGVMLLVGAGLLLRSLHQLWRTDPGFNASQVVAAKVDLPDNRYPYLKQIAFYDEIVQTLRALPDVEAAAAAAPLPLSGNRFGLSFEQPGVALPRSRRPSADFVMVGPGYFRAMAMPLVKGRDVSDADRDATSRVIVVNEAFARQYLADRNPIGERIRLGLSTTEPEAPWREIIGVVRDARIRALNEPPRPTVFVPYAQGLISTLQLVIRSANAPSTVIAETRTVIERKDPQLALYGVRTVEEYVSRSVATPRFQTVLLTLFAALALVLTAVGLYGVVAYGVAQRTREFGIRIALGAEPQSVVRLVLRDAATMAAAGVALGFLAAVGMTRYMSSALYGVHRFDPVTFAGVVVTLFAAALLASAIPARRAARTDPIRALRSD